LKKIYSSILEQAIPFYEKGRERDVAHVKWLFKTIPKYVRPDELDYDILMPVAILHDVGYSAVPKGASPLNLDIRKLHSEEGAKIAGKILSKLDYSKEKIPEIEKLVLKHDNWAFGDSFRDEPILSAFNNFDFLWVLSPDGFKSYQQILEKDAPNTIMRIEEDQKANLDRGMKWFNDRIEKFYNQLLSERKKMH